ncbi:MAG: sugar ABC transporter substrate-binding protein [Chloroflexi bacterium]|nr:sugar ABC transporter substrate-binding protein [Chloroflexota bacterium]
MLVLSAGVPYYTGQEAAAQDDITICFAFQDLETEFWVAGHRAITETLRDMDIEVIEVNGNQDANRQYEQVIDCIAQGVDGIILIPQDGESAVTIVGEANDNDVPIAVFNRPPSDDNPNDAIVVVADNEIITQQAVEYMAEQAQLQFEETGDKLQPLILVGDLGDPNAVGRRQGFYNVIEANPDLFEDPIEVATEWDAATALANFEAAMVANPEVNFIFTSSDFLYPTIRSVLEPMDKWVPVGEEGHVILGGLDGDATACMLMLEGYVDATGVQDLFYEAEITMDALLAAIEDENYWPNEIIPDPGFALTQGNIEEREMDMWGCVLYDEGFLDE